MFRQLILAVLALGLFTGGATAQEQKEQKGGGHSENRKKAATNVKPWGVLKPGECAIVNNELKCNDLKFARALDSLDKLADKAAPLVDTELQRTHDWLKGITDKMFQVIDKSMSNKQDARKNGSKSHTNDTKSKTSKHHAQGNSTGHGGTKGDNHKNDNRNPTVGAR
jgi:hypothetical protein